MRLAGFLCALLMVLSPGCRKTEIGFVNIDPVLASLVPDDTTALAGARLEELRETPVYKRLVEQGDLTPLNELARTGLDPRTDVRELLVVSNGKTKVLMARGRFDLDKVEAGLQGSEAQKTVYEGCTFIGDEKSTVAFIDSTTALGGETSAVRSLVSQRGSSDGLPSALMEKIKLIGIRPQVWAVSLGGIGPLESAVPQAGNLANLSRIFASLESYVAAADLTSGVNFAADGWCATEEDARTLHDAFRGFVGIGRLTTPSDQPELLGFYDGIRVEQKDRQVSLRTEIDADLMERLLQLAEKFRRVRG